MALVREATSGLLEHRADALGGGRGLEGGEPLLEQRGWGAHDRIGDGRGLGEGKVTPVAHQGE